MSPQSTVPSFQRTPQATDLAAERLIERLLQAIQGKLQARKGTVTEAQKLIIEVHRGNGDTFEITLSSKAR